MLVRNEPRQIRGHLLGKTKCALPGFFERFRWHDLGDDANQSAVSSVHADGVGNHISLSNILVWDAAAMRLIPIDNELLYVAVADDVFAHVIVLAIDVLDLRVFL